MGLPPQAVRRRRILDFTFFSRPRSAKQSMNKSAQRPTQTAFPQSAQFADALPSARLAFALAARPSANLPGPHIGGTTPPTPTTTLRAS